MKRGVNIICNAKFTLDNNVIFIFHERQIVDPTSEKQKKINLSWSHLSNFAIKIASKIPYSFVQNATTTALTYIYIFKEITIRGVPTVVGSGQDQPSINKLLKQK